MKVGVILPQGWTGEYRGWQPGAAWTRTRDLARQAEALGFESIWLFDHFTTVPRPSDELTFESFTTLSALAALTERVRLGQIVLCTAFRNPALTAKMISTLDVVSGARMELGIGAGWKRDEWVAYGYPYPSTGERLSILADHLEVITRMMGSGRATYRGAHARVAGAINEPKPIQRPRVPIMVGGNGANVTWRLAARHADELNLDGMSPDEVRRSLPTVRERCEEIGRDPATLPVSVHVWWERLERDSVEPAQLIAAYRETGVSRVMTLVRAAVDSDDALASFADACRAGGASLEQSTALGA